MKNKLITVILIIAVGTIYLGLDRSLFPYGESNFTFYRLLPMKIKPENRPDFEGGFTIWDEHGMSLVSKGSRYWQVDSIQIDKIISYGYNDDLLVARIIDTEGSVYSFAYSENKDPDFKPDISVRLFSDEEESLDKNLKWIEIGGNKDIGRIILVRNWLKLLFIGLSIYLMVLYFKKEKQQTANNS